MVIVITKINSERQLTNLSQSLVNTEPMMAHDSGLLVAVENNEVYQNTRKKVDSFFDGLDNTTASLVISQPNFNLIKDGANHIQGMPKDSFVVIYNSDYVIPRGCVKSMVDYLRFYPGLGIVSAMEVGEENVSKVAGNIYEPSGYLTIDNSQMKMQCTDGGLYAVDLVRDNLFAIRKHELDELLSNETPYEGCWGLSLRKCGYMNAVETNITIRKEV